MHTITFHTSLLFCTISIFQNKIKECKKDLESPWITKRIKKSSNCKPKLYVKFLENRNSKNELENKNYKKLFELIKKRAKKNYFSSLILKHIKII